MSWHTSAIVVQGNHIAGIEKLLASFGFPGMTRTGEISGDAAGSSGLPGRAVAFVDGWTFIWDPMMFRPLSPADQMAGMWPEQLDQALIEISRSYRIFSFITEGTSSTHGFSFYADGELRRLLLSQ